MNPFLLSLLFGVAAALASLTGALLILHWRWQGRKLFYFIAVGAGFMLAAALTEMLPASIALVGNGAFAWVLGGYLAVHFFEHGLTGHFHMGEETHAEEHIGVRASTTAVLGMSIHTLFDGGAISAGVLESTCLGGIVFVAVMLHKIPDGVTVASVMLAAGRSRKAVLLASILVSGATLVGVAGMWIFRDYVGYGLALASGATIYVAASDLIPEVNRTPGVAMPLWVFSGVALMLGFHWVLHLF